MQNRKKPSWLDKHITITDDIAPLQKQPDAETKPKRGDSQIIADPSGPKTFWGVMNVDLSKITTTNWWRIFGVLVGIALGALFMYLGIQFWDNYRAQQKEVEQKQEQEKLLLQKQLEQQQADAKSQGATLDKLKQQVTDLKNRPPEVRTVTNINLPAIVKQWRPRIAYIECDFYYTNGKFIESKAGSGVWIDYKSNSRIVTNRHIVSRQDEYGVGPFGSCRSKFPDNNNIFTSTMDSIRFSIAMRYDYGYITISPDEHIKNLPPVTYCAMKAVIGDSVIIFGYPGIGSQTDITVTEGIISGYDGDYYITSAKIERGNSGGAAILVRPYANCYLGPPSFVQIGAVESLARILDFHAIP
ncbi:MAG: trypsin-like peptidase domain-containing protein [bacterium]|nr:trypsin-like peptidase domain-containing protein [bacterium]